MSAQRIILRKTLIGSHNSTTTSSITVLRRSLATTANNSSISSIRSKRNSNNNVSDNYYFSTAAMRSATATAQNPLLISRRFKSFQSTPPLYNDTKEHSAEEASAPPAADVKDGEVADDCPEYQNPLHHKDDDPNAKKFMLDDFGPDETPEIVPLPPLDDGSGKVIAAPHLHDLAQEIVTLNMLEVKELVDRIGEHFGIDENEEDDFGDEAGGGAEAAAEEKEEKTAFDLKLTGFDAKAKIKVIKEVRAITGLGLKEAKELVEGAPKTVKKEIKMEEAEELKAKIEAVGGTVEIE